MKALKRKIADLTRCYCVAPLRYQQQPHFLVASEKEFACLLFDRYGNQIDEVWNSVGGTMSAVQLPGVDGAFLATHKFYSPNNSKEAKIVCCWHEESGWKVRTIVELPYVHRFDILSRGGRHYLLACCLKSGYEYNDDWRFPGATYACRLPDDLTELTRDAQITLKALKSGMYRNHGYSRHIRDGVMTGLVTSDEGVFRFTPPAADDDAWTIDTLITDPASDAVMADFDGDGQDELLTLSPFHGDTLRVYHADGITYKPVFEYEKRIEFAHAICSGTVCKKVIAVIGHRKGERDLLSVSYQDGGYHVETLDHDVGPANVLSATVDGRDVLLSANREINEVAYYEITAD